MVSDSIVLLRKSSQRAKLGVQSELVHIKHLLTWTQATTFEANSKNSKAVRRSDLSFDFTRR